jgi:hypothetical protein
VAEYGEFGNQKTLITAKRFAFRHKNSKLHFSIDAPLQSSSRLARRLAEGAKKVVPVSGVE